MGHPKHHHEEKHTLLPLSSSSSNSMGHPSNSSDEDNNNSSDYEVEFEKKTKYFRTKLAAAIRRTSKNTSNNSSSLLSDNRRKTNSNRNLAGKRFVRFLLCAFLIPMSLFVFLYSSLFSSSSSRHYPLPDWNFDVSLNISDYISPLNDTTILEPRQKCADKYFVLIVVTSSLNSFVTRQTIRETWGNTTEFNYPMFEKMHAHLSDKYLQPKKQRLKLYQQFLKLYGNQTTISPTVTIPVRVLFLLGQAKPEIMPGNAARGSGVVSYGNETQIRLRQEADLYDDIIQEQFIDSYNNLTIKSVMALKWITQNRCYEQVAYFMKVDDDTFVNVPNLLHFLLGGTVPLYNETLDFYDANTYQTLSAISRLNMTNDYMVGHKFCKAPVLSNTKSKWYMPYYMFPQDEYPNYLSGSGYLMSMDVVPKLYKAALNTSLIYLEDVYVTGVCATKVNLKRHHHPLFFYSKSKHSCTLKGMITMHKMRVEDMYASYNFVTNFTYQCPPPGKYFKRIRLRRLHGCG